MSNESLLVSGTLMILATIIVAVGTIHAAGVREGKESCYLEAAREVSDEQT